MQYDVKTPTEYIAILEEDWRKEKLLLIRDMILRHAPELKEKILYKMLCYGNEEGVFALNAQKGYVSLYVGTILKIDQAKELLAGFDTGKGCIRIRKSIDLQHTQLETFIVKTIAMWRNGEDISC